MQNKKMQNKKMQNKKKTNKKTFIVRRDKRSKKGHN
jgi:hypothetical protein